MILLDVKRYIKQRGQVSAADIKNKFDVSQDTLEGWMHPLLKQGHVQIVAGGVCESQCSTGCTTQTNPTDNTHYLWITKKQPNLMLAVEVV